jgi:hypothetical protein
VKVCLARGIDEGSQGITATERILAWKSRLRLAERSGRREREQKSCLAATAQRLAPPLSSRSLIFHCAYSPNVICKNLLE